VSDLPPPDVFEQYPKELQALMLKRIETDIDNDKKLIDLEVNEQVLRTQELTEESTLKKRGQIFAFLSLVLLGGLAVFFAFIGAYNIAGTIVGVTMVGSITAFIGFGRRRDKTERAVKKK
jgi:uncharacterized membrane protein